MSWRTELPSEGLDKIIWQQCWDVQRKQRQVPVLAGITHAAAQARGDKPGGSFLEDLGSLVGWSSGARPERGHQAGLGAVNVVCGQRARELGLPAQGAQHSLTPACKCNYLVGGEKSNQALCTLQDWGNKHNFWVLKALDLPVMHYRFPAVIEDTDIFLPDYSFGQLCLASKTVVQRSVFLYHWRTCSFSLPHDQRLFSTSSQFFYF